MSSRYMKLSENEKKKKECCYREFFDIKLAFDKV